jgi:hypothetical protein
MSRLEVRKYNLGEVGSADFVAQVHAMEAAVKMEDALRELMRVFRQSAPTEAILSRLAAELQYPAAQRAFDAWENEGGATPTLDADSIHDYVWEGDE